MSLLPSLLKSWLGSLTSKKPQPTPKPSKPSATLKPMKAAAKPAQDSAQGALPQKANAKPPAGKEGADMPWVNAMRGALGLHESKDKVALEKWLKSDGDMQMHPDDTPWCGEGVATALKLSIPGIQVPSGHWASSNWLKWGTAVKPQLGCVLIFWRGSPKSWQGHIAFYVGEDALNYFILGANQNDAITITKIAKNRLRKDGARWPLLGPLPTNKILLMDGSGMALSTNEA